MDHMVMEAERLGLRSVGKGDGGEELDVDERELKLYLANTMEEDGVKEEVWEGFIKYIYYKNKSKNKQKLGITSEPEEVMGTRKIRKSKWGEPEKKQDRRGVRKC